MKSRLKHNDRVRINNKLSQFHGKKALVRTRFLGGQYVVDLEIDSERFPRGLSFKRSELVHIKDVQ